MDIRVIAPVTSQECEARAFEQYSAGARRDTRISTVLLERGPASIESAYEEMLAAPGVLAQILEAEREGMDAVISNCMADPGVAAGREIASIPVIGPAEASMHLAAMLGERFSVVTVLERLIPALRRCAHASGLSQQLASVRAVNIPVLELTDRTRAATALVHEAIRAVQDDGAHVIVLGCTGMAGLAGAVQQGLAQAGINDVPVVDPAMAALKIAEALVDMGLSHSKPSWTDVGATGSGV